MDILASIKKENLLGYGSNRIVFSLDDEKVIKIPYNNIGIESNKLEYEYYNKKPNIVAKIYSYNNNLIIQEKLSDIITVPYKYTIDGSVKKYLNSQGITVDDELINEMLNTKLQIGKDKLGKWKFFDYEDAKVLNSEESMNSLRIKQNIEYLNRFWDYIKSGKIENIKLMNTFEDYINKNT